ncbi:MAG: diguanylate cyclase, partial [Burkholderiales bacterium]|nr:diguanylate cyclase [Burkholderiales bacterium]
MALTLSQVQARLERYGRRNESFLYFFSCYGLPLLIGLGSVLAFLSWPDQFPQAKPSPASIKVIRQSSEIETPAQALEAVRSQAAVGFLDTQLSDDPFWMVLPPTEGSALGQLAVEFPSRHAMALSCWNARSLTLLGQAERSGALHQIRPAKAGFALEMDAPARAGGLVCKVGSVGPARLTAVLWDVAELQASGQEFHRRSCLL